MSIDIDEECVLQNILQSDLDYCLLSQNNLIRGGGKTSELLYNCVLQKNTDYCIKNQVSNNSQNKSSFDSLPQSLILEIGQRLDKDGRRKIMFLNKLLKDTLDANQVKIENRDVYANILYDIWCEIYTKYPSVNIIIEFKHWEEGTSSVLLRKLHDTKTFVSVYENRSTGIRRTLANVLNLDFPGESAYFDYTDKERFKKTIMMLSENRYSFITPTIVNSNFIQMFKQLFKQSNVDKIYKKFNFYYDKEYDWGQKISDLYRKIYNQSYGIGNGMMRKKYKGRSYKIRIGSKGGKYILVQGKKIYI